MSKNLLSEEVPPRMNEIWIPITDTGHYDTYAEAYRDALKKRQRKNAKDWEDGLRILDELFAKEGEP